MFSEHIDKYMSKSLITIELDNNLSYAIHLMHDNHLRHLPVYDDDKLVGMLSEGDIRLIQSFTRDHLAEISVGEACTNNPYVVKFNCSVGHVAGVMCEKRYSSALVVDDDDRLIGIFTWIDALGILNSN
jgi:CBS domain-containing protein